MCCFRWDEILISAIPKVTIADKQREVVDSTLSPSALEMFMEHVAGM
jgi:hypothetical protein